MKQLLLALVLIVAHTICDAAPKEVLLPEHFNNPIMHQVKLRMTHQQVQKLFGREFGIKFGLGRYVGGFVDDIEGVSYRSSFVFDKSKRLTTVWARTKRSMTTEEALSVLRAHGQFKVLDESAPELMWAPDYVKKTEYFLCISTSSSVTLHVRHLPPNQEHWWILRSHPPSEKFCASEAVDGKVKKDAKPDSTSQHAK
jgi:hypothetical protein